jgi:exopolysaccharide biosynthesis polyprenyl glycosylphosphotransferase
MSAVAGVTPPSDSASIDAAPLQRALRRERLISTRLLVADAAAIVGALMIVAFLSGDTLEADRGRLAPATLVFVAACLAGARIYALHRGELIRHGHSTVDEIGAVIALVAAGEWVFTVALGFLGLPSLKPSTLVLLWALAVSFMLVLRAGVRSRYRQHPAVVENTVIVGAGDVGQLVARKLLHHPEYGLRLIGFVDDRPRDKRPDLEHLTLLGGIQELDSLVATRDIQRVIVAFSNEPEAQRVELLRRLGFLGIRVDIVPRLFDALTPQCGFGTVEGFPLISLHARRPSLLYKAGKRMVDVVGASAGLLFTAPLFGLIALWIKLDSPGPVLFRQTRYGINMREFTSLKFRTMAVDASPEQHREYIRATMNGDNRPASNGLFKLDREEAVTRAGRWLRRTSLDELPQLLNVLRGDMSLVGPRPCIPYEVEHFAPHHFERFLVPQGLTGLWQVNARAHSSFYEALEMDIAYTRARSFGLDLRLIMKTPIQILTSATR